MKRILIGVLAAGIFLGACTGGNAESQSIDAMGDQRAIGSEPREAADDVAESAGADEAIGAGSSQLVLTGRKIIRQASLVLRDDDPEAVFERIVALVEGAGGFVATSDLQRTDDEEPPRIDMTLRLPSGSLTATVAAVTETAAEVVSRQLGSTDVTAQYVDIEARLRNLQTLESELLLLLTEVRDVTDPEARDLLLVFDRLQSVRLEIEQLTGQKQALDDQVDLATLRVSIVPTPPVIEITDDSWRPGDQVRESLASLVDVLENLANFAIWAGVFLVPVLAMIAIPVGLVWWLATRRSRRDSRVESDPAPPVTDVVEEPEADEESGERA